MFFCAESLEGIDLFLYETKRLGRKRLWETRCCSSMCCFCRFNSFSTNSGGETWRETFALALGSWCCFLYIFLIVPCFLQCSHVTSMQSPYVLNSTGKKTISTQVSLSVLTKTLQKRHSNRNTHRSSDGNLLWCTFLHSASSHRYLMSPSGKGWGYFLIICK